MDSEGGTEVARKPPSKISLMKLTKSELAKRLGQMGLQITGSKEAMAEAITGAAGPDALPAPRTANRAAPLATVASVDEDGVGAMKVAELKARLKSLGVNASGTKPELQARLRGFAESDAKGTLRVHGASREDFRLASAQITGSKAAMAEAPTGAAGPDALPAPRAANRAAPLATVASVDEPAFQKALSEAGLQSSGVMPSGTKPVNQSVHGASPQAPTASKASVSSRPWNSAIQDMKEGVIAGKSCAAPGDSDSVKAVRMLGGLQPVEVTVDKTKKGKDTDELGLTRADKQNLLHKCMRSLYKRCLRSAQSCPDEKWQETMHIYVRNRFRDSSTDTLPVRLSVGEAELEQMESYHTSRQLAAAAKERLYQS